MILLNQPDCAEPYQKTNGSKKWGLFRGLPEKDEEELINNEEFLKRIRENILFGERIESEDGFLAVK